MAVAKMSISMDAELAERIRAAAEAEGRSVSAWISEVLAKRLRRDNLRMMLDEYEAEHGAFTDEEMAQARQDLKLDEIPWS